MQATQSVKWNEMYKWKDDKKYSGYEPEQLCAKANVDHTISGQGTGISSVDHSATTPRVNMAKMAKKSWQTQTVGSIGDDELLLWSSYSS